jgi:hypothetical protein
MSAIIEVIKHIAVIVEQRKIANIPGEFLAYREPYPACEYVTFSDLNQEQNKLISEYCNPQPRLTLRQINELVEPYRFRLPQEIYDLYQMGNGGLPIGISEEKDWDSIYNYFNFPSSENALWTLSNSMNTYQDLLIESNPRLLPICIYGDESTLFVLGGTESQENAPLLWTHDDCLNDDISQMEILWPSLTNMMFAYAERLEALSERSLTESKERSIYQKYSSGSELGWYKFCH